MVKVLHITTEYPPHRTVGSLAIQVRDLVIKLSSNHEIYLVHPAGFEGSYMDGNIRICTVIDRWFSDVVAYMHFLLVEVLSRIPYVIPRDMELIHAHDWIASVIARVISQRLKVPYIASVYSTEPLRSGNAMNLINLTIRDWEKYAFSSANYAIAHNRPTYESLGRDYGINAMEAKSIDDIEAIYKDISHQRVHHGQSVVSSSRT
ncbi:glycosyltransferase [Vulcanisaeta souniana]|uniref:Glycosyltransferase subfamily 4-like N-terminal domain-containing protein n=1 Tax=Vulcanisaeta souniana JCM 11219 TaxID=1293586 RepID=A0A830E465_9CREN|nr:glycosyltransferase [Vulcanisaeta souniana]BDR91933.1 hypothetical protein Vsou_10260 [Vulcanisaeta souniana JCM 11219]GGI69241.1 hypothetical protein GCM10007112_02780 [Vulcanisaeta souniana JCM 11219]